MGLRVCLVTPFAWSRAHDVNEHVDGLARELRKLGHQVTVLAPSTRASDLVAGRRALLDGVAAAEAPLVGADQKGRADMRGAAAKSGLAGKTRAEAPQSTSGVIALGPAFPVSRRSRIGVPVGVRANLALALERGRFEIVHGFEPALPSLSYLALRDSHALGVATFLSAERLGYPPGKPQRRRLLSRIDALLATSPEVAEAAALRLSGDYRIVSPGVDAELFRPAPKRKLIVFEWRPVERPLARSVLRALRELSDWELVMLRTKPLTGRPTIPRGLADRVTVRTARDGAARAPLLNEAAIFVPAIDGLDRVALEAAAAGAAIAKPPGLRSQPELAGAATARLAEDDAFREGEARANRESAERQTFGQVAQEHDILYRKLAQRRRATRTDDPLAGRDWIVCDLHLHTSWSHDCAIEVGDLLTHAEAEGLGAIAITDHNVFGGALEALAATTALTVIPGEEIKTEGQGEVIGLYLTEEIPPGMSFADTLAAIREQDAVAYLPHPFDRMHAIPDAATLRRHLDEIDVFEVYNARLLFEAYNEEALRFARKYNLTMAAGSDAHVLQGVGTGALRMREFHDREEFLVSLRSAQVLRRPRSLLYLQSLKWAAQAKERVR
jgi:predicted metal-dependent phosphoesterase TrpH/glycosyltransferase involved in cell wall biosynthesis